jgi:hypothetical protein
MELQDLVPYIDDGDVELLEAAGVPEHGVSYPNEEAIEEFLTDFGWTKKGEGENRVCIQYTHPSYGELNIYQDGGWEHYDKDVTSDPKEVGKDSDLVRYLTELDDTRKEVGQLTPDDEKFMKEINDAFRQASFKSALLAANPRKPVGEKTAKFKSPLLAMKHEDLKDMYIGNDAEVAFSREMARQIPTWKIHDQTNKEPFMGGKYQIARAVQDGKGSYVVYANDKPIAKLEPGYFGVVPKYQNKGIGAELARIYTKDFPDYKPHGLSPQGFRAFEKALAPEAALAKASGKTAGGPPADECFATLEEATGALKMVKDEASFKLFERRLKATHYYKTLDLYSKRSGRHAFGFNQDQTNPEKVRYLLDDGISYGRCRWKNLWRSLKLRGEGVMEGDPVRFPLPPPPVEKTSVKKRDLKKDETPWEGEPHKYRGYSDGSSCYICGRTRDASHHLKEEKTSGVGEVLSPRRGNWKLYAWPPGTVQVGKHGEIVRPAPKSQIWYADSKSAGLEIARDNWDLSSEQENQLLRVGALNLPNAIIRLTALDLFTAPPKRLSS